MTNEELQIIKGEILECLTEDFGKNQAIFDKEERISVLLDREVETYDGYKGIVVGDYISKNTRMIHLKQQDNKIWCCPLKNIKKVIDENGDVGR